MKSTKKGRSPVRLKLLKESSRKDDEDFKELLKLIDECDGAVIVLQKGRTVRLHYFGLNSDEIIYALEWGKIKFFKQQGII